jgi:hypothetical protein
VTAGMTFISCASLHANALPSVHNARDSLES